MTWTKTSLHDIIRQRLGDELFIVVSNREPYLHQVAGGEVVCRTPASGVALALDPVMQACGGIWVAHGSGAADRRVVDAQDHVAVPPEQPSYTLRRVWLTKAEEDGYYHGLANEALWPLCHIVHTRPVFRAAAWQTYCEVNRKFAAVILEEVGRRQAFVFIQDYHFALLPRLLKRPNIRTAQFWHIPWPNPEAFRICPWGTEILDGLLGNDLLGFHLRYHCQNFIDTVDRMLEARIDRECDEINRNGLTTMVRPFPISVDYAAIAAHAAGPDVTRRLEELKRRHGLQAPVIGLGVDRVDYTKGIPERLRGIERFFARYPEFQGRMTFVQIGVPSRIHLDAYQRLHDEIDQLVERINWQYGRDDWPPILYVRENVPPPLLRAWYRLADFCLITALHDGMNLVAKEFIASRVDEDGVLILSQFTGAARELTDALLVNPYAVDEMPATIHQALTMPQEERQRRMRKLRRQVEEQNVYRWAGKILSTLLQFEFQDA